MDIICFISTYSCQNLLRDTVFYLYRQSTQLFLCLMHLKNEAKNNKKNNGKIKMLINLDDIELNADGKRT